MLDVSLFLVQSGHQRVHMRCIRLQGSQNFHSVQQRLETAIVNKLSDPGDGKRAQRNVQRKKMLELFLLRLRFLKLYRTLLYSFESPSIPSINCAGVFEAPAPVLEVIDAVCHYPMKPD